MFWSTAYLAIYAGYYHLITQYPYSIINEAFTLRTGYGNHTGYLMIFLRFKIMECKVLQLPFDMPHPQPVSERSVNLQCFLGYGLAPVPWKCLEGVHIVEPVRQLDENHAQVFCHSDQHFT